MIPKGPLVDTRDSRIAGVTIQGGMEDWAIPSAVKFARTIRLRTFGRWRGGRGTSIGGGGFCRWLLYRTEWTDRSAARIDRMIGMILLSRGLVPCLSKAVSRTFLLSLIFLNAVNPGSDRSASAVGGDRQNRATGA
jgi:hypothetical protein